MRPLNYADDEDAAIIQKIREFASDPGKVTWSRTAEQDIADTQDMSKSGVLAALLDHVCQTKLIQTDKMRNGDTAYIARRCLIGRFERYVKVKFWALRDEEKMHVFAAHEN
jgi:hypothetical protein